MDTVYKYELIAAYSQDIFLPHGAKVIHVAAQNDKICLWAIVDPTVPLMLPRRFYVVGTGHVIPENVNHIGTALIFNGQLVFHVFEEPLP